MFMNILSNLQVRNLNSALLIVTRAFDSAERAADDLADDVEDYFTSSAIREFRQQSSTCEVN